MSTRELIQAIRRHWRWGTLPLVGSALFVVYRYLDGVAGGSTEPLSRVAVKEFGGGTGTVLLLVPLVLLIVRFPVHGRKAYKNLPAHALGVVVYSFLHTSWNWAFRTGIYGLAGWGRYDYGHMPTRYLMEFPLDLMAYVIVVVAVSMIQRARATREREVQMVRLQEQLQRARLAQLQTQLRPHFLFNALNTVSSVMYQDVGRADGVLQALADILRKMVDQSERTVVPLSEELSLVDAMTQVMEARFGDRLRVKHDVEDGVLDWPVPPLL
ncbi:MAG: histidine kinase, partial [Gemmatimonadetes bacterium]|nr:histidine kinase [Gemmatimonadota bacterium]